MVGVPGKSKGCSTCRRRKKGCDQKRPVCGQCSASGYVCGGYQRDLTFVLHPSSKAVENALFLPTKPRRSLLASFPSLERTAVVSQCQDLFFNVYLPHGRCECRDPHILRCARTQHWTDVINDLNHDDRSLELAFAAFSISRVGRNRDDPRLIKESTKFYGKALKNLQKALYDPSRMHTEPVLTACLLLGLYETFEGAGGTSAGWVSHAQGAARIVELRGPDLHAEQPAHILFLGTRPRIIYSAILRRKKTFLAEEQWLTVPWFKQKKTGFDRLVDVVTHIPGLLEQLDSVRSMTPSANQRQVLHSCLATCRKLQQSLGHWNTVRRPNSLPVAVKHNHVDEGDNYPFAMELTFENHLFLNANLVYWSAGLVVATAISEVELLLTTFGFEPTNMLNLAAPAMQEAQDCAVNIVKSIPYCLCSDMGDLGIDYLHFPMGLAFQFFVQSNNSTVCAWMIARASEMQKSGAAVLRQTEETALSSAPGSFESNIGAFPGFVSTKRTIESYIQNGSHHNLVSTRVGSSSPTYLGHTESTYPTVGVSAAPGAALQNKSIDVALINDPDFDADYDTLSDYEGESPHSGSMGRATICRVSRHDSAGEFDAAGEASCSPSEAEVDFAFVQEDPAQYYIDKSEAVAIERP